MRAMNLRGSGEEMGGVEGERKGWNDALKYEILGKKWLNL